MPGQANLNDLSDNTGTKSTTETVDFKTSAESKILIDSNEITYDISSIQLDQYVNNHHKLQLRIRHIGVSSGSNEFEDFSNFTGFLGKPISLKVKPTGGIVESDKRLKFIGLVTEVRLESSIDGINTVLLTAHSPTIALDFQKKNKRHPAGGDCGDIVGAILANYSITKGRIDPSPVLTVSGALNPEVDSTIQFDETDYVYICRLASEHSMFAYYDGSAFNMEKAKGNNTQELQWRTTLGAFSLGMSAGPLKYSAKVWDPRKKDTVECETDRSKLRSALTELSRTALDGSERVFTAKGISSAPKHTSQSNADKAVIRETESTVGKLMVCKGTSIVPAVTVGSSIKIKDMGTVDGEYWVTAISHKVNDSGQYHNTFTCSPLELAFPVVQRERQQVRHLQTGVVTDNNDPDDLGRVKVRLVWAASDEETEYMRIMTPDGGAERGWFALPEVGDEVLVGYERGNPDLPIVLGCLYNGVDKPPKPTSEVLGDGVETKLYRTRNGNEIIFKDKDGEEKITISQKDGENTIVLDMSGPSITIESSGDISIKGTNISLEATSGDISMKAGAKLTGEANTDIQLKAGANFKSEGGMNYEAKGGVGFKATGVQANLEGSAMTTIKGGIVKIN